MGLTRVVNRCTVTTGDNGPSFGGSDASTIEAAASAGGDNTSSAGAEASTLSEGGMERATNGAETANENAPRKRLRFNRSDWRIGVLLCLLDPRPASNVTAASAFYFSPCFLPVSLPSSAPPSGFGQRG
jgi:hypothetical protein